MYIIRIYKVTPSGTAAYCTLTGGAYGLAIDANSNIWITQQTDNNIAKISTGATLSSGACDTLGKYAVGGSPGFVAVDGLNNIWISASFVSVAYAVKMNSSGTVIGSYSLSGGIGMTGAGPGIAVDSNNNVWISRYATQNLVKLSNSG